MTTTTQKFTKVRAGWYYIDVVSWEEAFDDSEKEQLTIDVSRVDYGYWVVTTRKNETLQANSDPYVTLHDTCKEAKAHAIRLAKMWSEFNAGSRDYYPTVRDAA